MKTHLRPLVLIACITAATAFGSQFAFADAGPGPQHGQTKCGERQQGFRKGHFFNKMARELGLSEQQKSQAKAILQNSRAENKPLFKSLMAERRQMRSLILSGTADEGAIRAQSAKIAAVQADLAVKRAQEAKQLRALLTPEQATKAQKLIEQRQERFRKHRMHEGMEPQM